MSYKAQNILCIIILIAVFALNYGLGYFGIIK